MNIYKRILTLPIKIYFDRFSSKKYKNQLAKYIADLCPEDSYILDYGCDDGSTALKIRAYKPSLKIVGVDVQSNRISKIPRKIFSGNKIPYPDKTFDIVIALDVLHHTKDIPERLIEMKRVSKKYLIIKDHATYSIFSKILISFTDFFANVAFGIACAFNYPLLKEWFVIFEKQNLKVISQLKGLDYGFCVNERYNPIFKLEKE